MAQFIKAFQYLISNEDYAPTDPRYGKVHTDNDGGQVRFGINSNSLGKVLLNTTYFTTMPNDQAIKVAENLYNTVTWEIMHGDSIHSQSVGSKLLDLSVNSGTAEAAKLAQRSVNVNVDGNIGVITLAAINAMNEDDVLKNLTYWWNWLITQIINSNPVDIKYEKAWRARADKLPPIEPTGASNELRTS